ncbi:MAG: NAD(P)-dependent alcohol dehydrogenase [Caldilineaceae bacterium SB0665_bin_21]|nr:NAD(P)-dependent alcohol dehydrogenase [Caldilineaceae bacterium SB0665_bin_21]MYA04888.1 NAD(P)-dependent alcohol dehydrogenase [Caldilineaceae bacterium SB0664_bin_22]MYC63873.1 NAD(P)-dependent alcohol dehydrogenase [Caldilineaceae bacterium SB0661_bin_34]
MKAIVQSGYGTPEQVLRLGEIDRPSVGDDDVLVRMRASSVNTPDWLTVTGTPYILRLKFGLRGPRTAVRGSDLAGVVEAVGQDVTNLKQGDEVFGSSWADDLGTSGTFADYAVAPAAKLIRKPTGLTFEDASASVMSGLTALIAIRDVANAGPHTRLLINGASGGVGTFAVQIAKTLGAEVTGVCSTRNLELVNSLGADHVIDYTEEDFTQSGKRYDVILDNVMNYWPPKLSSALAPGGMLIPNSIGTTGGMFASLFKVARATLMGQGSIEVKFVNLEVTHENLNDLAKLHESGDVKPVIDTVYPLKEAPKAVAHMLGHHAAGNIVIKM